jgi:hypothetical protein
MPYIPPERRIDLSEGQLPQTPGELNFLICDLVDDYLAAAIQADETEGLTYGQINEVMGVLECAKLEVFRRLAAPLEKRKLKENGEVFYVV